jgi:hypothetical protein
MIRWAVASMGERNNAYKILLGKHCGQLLLGRQRRKKVGITISRILGTWDMMIEQGKNCILWHDLMLAVLNIQILLSEK